MNQQIWAHVIIFAISVGAIVALIVTGHGTPGLETLLFAVLGGVGGASTTAALGGIINKASSANTQEQQQ